MANRDSITKQRCDMNPRSIVLQIRKFHIESILKQRQHGELWPEDLQLWLKKSFKRVKLFIAL